jgi:hypothetical protein
MEIDQELYKYVVKNLSRLNPLIPRLLIYSRQIYVLGDQAMNRLAVSDVLLCGCGSLGIEIGK